MEFQLSDIDIRSIGSDIFKNLWMIVLVMLGLYFGIAGGYRLTYIPEYTTTATVAITNQDNQSNNNYRSLTTAINMAAVFEEVFESDTLKDKVNQELQINNQNYQISATVIEQTNLITLNVTTTNPKESYQIMQSALNNYAVVSDYLFSNADLQIVQEATVSMRATNAMNYNRYQLIALVGGGLMMVGLIALFSILRPTIKKKEGAKHQLDGRIVSTIPYQKKYKNLRYSKQAVLIDSALVSVSFSEANRKLGALVERHMKKRKQKILLVTSVAENEGKSSIASNIALSMVARGNKVLIVDCDFKRPGLKKVFELNNEFGLSDYLDGKCEFKDVILTKNNLSIICQNDTKDNSNSYFLMAQFKLFINQCYELFDYIIVDTPPMGACVDAESVMPYCQTSLMVVREDWSEVGAINDFSDVLKQDNHDFMGFVLNAFHGQSFDNSYSYYQNYQRRSFKNRQVVK